jgi:nucleoside-diphosphate-sugar epimerase
MRIVVTGASGNVGTSVVRALAGEPIVHEILGLVRRLPAWQPPKVRWVRADVARDDLSEHLAGADAVVHLAWLIQPSRDDAELERVNVDGSRRVFEAAGRAGVQTLVHASSVGVYSPGPKDRPVDESWPREGVPTLFYARHKAAAERALDAIERSFPQLRVVRLRPALVFKREAGPEIRRLFAGPLLPSALLGPGRLPILPLPDRLVFQCVHGDDVAEAYRLAVMNPDARGAYNIAAEPVIGPDALARILRARRVRVPEKPLRAAADATFRAHLQPAPPGWLDMGLQVPTMDTTRAREQLGWTPRRDAASALLELLEGMREPTGLDTPPLRARAGGALRVRELLTGLGRRL